MTVHAIFFAYGHPKAPIFGLRSKLINTCYKTDSSELTVGDRAFENHFDRQTTGANKDVVKFNTLHENRRMNANDGGE